MVLGWIFLGRVGINNLLLPDVQEGLEGKKWWDSASAAAIRSYWRDWGKYRKRCTGNFRRAITDVEWKVCCQCFLKTLLKPIVMLMRVSKSKTGVSIMDEVSSMDLLVQGMALLPSECSHSQLKANTAIYELNRKLNERRSRLMALWSRVKMMDDQQEMDEIWEEIQKVSMTKIHHVV